MANQLDTADAMKSKVSAAAWLAPRERLGRPHARPARIRACNAHALALPLRRACNAHALALPLRACGEEGGTESRRFF